jgi:hypothetical protein
MGGFPTGSPKEFVKSVADGFANISVVSLRKFQPPHLKILLQNITIYEREVRSEVIEESDFESNRKKHFRLNNLNRARLMINEFIKHRRIKME